jgi:NAD-dependent deacetylase
MNGLPPRDDPAPWPPTPEAVEELVRAREILGESARVLVLTGAGISAESGIPTFRGPEGLWKEHRAEDLATPGAFRRDPRLVWEWYGWRRELIAACRPNPGHEALAAWLLARGGSACLATQNVDGLHTLAQEAATSGKGSGATAPARAPLLELHGSLFRVRCTECGAEAPHRTPVDATSADTLPVCPRCRGLLRPAVVWFGEMLPEPVVSEAFRWARSADAALVVGTSALVHPAASLPLETLGRGGRVVEVNPVPTGLTHLATVSLRGGAGTVLPVLVGTGETPRVSRVF